ncbi:MAG: tetratricopeptide repeat protein [Alphaproteobacteria bacterium]
MDLTTFALMVALAVAAITGDAVTSHDTLFTDVSVSAEMQTAGVDAATAEKLFEHNVAMMTRHRTLLSSPKLRSSKQQSLIEALGNTLQVDQLRVAAQRVFGLSPIEIHVSMQTLGQQDRLVIAGYDYRQRPMLIDIERPSGRYLELISEGAAHFVRWVSPYDYAIHLLEDRAGDPAAWPMLTAIVKEQRDPTVGAISLYELAIFENLAGILAMIEEDAQAAEHALLRALTLSPGLPHATANLAFLRTHQGRYRDAVELVNGLLEQSRRKRMPDVISAALLARAVALRELGMQGEAIADLREVLHLEPDSEAAYRYWAELEHGRGAAEDAERLQRAMNIGAATFDLRPELAAHYFFLPRDPTQPLGRRRAGR